MKTFDIPAYYRSSFISTIKNLRKETDPRKKDFSPTLLDFGSVQFLIARHFGFCYGVENAIEIAYKAVEENPEGLPWSQAEHHQALSQLDDGREVADEGESRPGGERNPQEMLGRLDAELAGIHGRRIQLLLLHAVALDLALDPQERLGPDGLRTGKTAPETSGQCGEEKQ